MQNLMLVQTKGKARGWATPHRSPLHSLHTVFEILVLPHDFPSTLTSTHPVLFVGRYTVVYNRIVTKRPIITKVLNLVKYK
jgi:hypothetical protein